MPAAARAVLPRWWRPDHDLKEPRPAP
jgi:hypothetical protein